jgi:hypothetical protein
MDNFTQPFVFFLFIDGSLYSEPKPSMHRAGLSKNGMFIQRCPN